MEKNAAYKEFLGKFKESNPSLMETIEKGFSAIFEGTSQAQSFSLGFSTDNDAFRMDFSGEVAKILRNVADKMERGESPNPIMDSNGNSIGKVSVS